MFPSFCWHSSNFFVSCDVARILVLVLTHNCIFGRRRWIIGFCVKRNKTGYSFSFFFPGGHLSIVLFIYWYYPVVLVILEFMQYILLLAIFICTKGLLRYCFR